MESSQENEGLRLTECGRLEQPQFRVLILIQLCSPEAIVASLRPSIHSYIHFENRGISPGVGKVLDFDEYNAEMRLRSKTVRAGARGLAVLEPTEPPFHRPSPVTRTALQDSRRISRSASCLHRDEQY